MPLEKQTNYVLFCLSHSMLSAFHQGVQSQRITSHLATDFYDDAVAFEMVNKWMAAGGNCEILNGGNTYNLREIWRLFEVCKSEGMTLPIVYHKANEDTFDGALTSIGILVPVEVFTHPGYREFNLDFNALSLKYPGIPVWHLHLMVILRALQPIR